MRVIVIGAGILGAATAYFLSQAPCELVIIDDNEPGRSTDTAAGLICPWISRRRNQAWYQLASQGAAYYPELVHRLACDGETDVGYRVTGVIKLESEKRKLEDLAALAENRKKDSPEIGNIELLSEEETAKRFPPVSAGYASLFISGGGRVDGAGLRKALLKAAVRRGASYREAKATLLPKGENRVSVRTGDQIWEADAVVVTAGAWAPRLLEPLGLKTEIHCQKGQTIHLHFKGADTETWPPVMLPGGKDIIPFSKGKIVLGATHEKVQEFHLPVTAGGIFEILKDSLPCAKGLLEADFAGAYAGFRPYTPDFLPVFGPVPGWEGLYFANGLGASGLSTGPYIGAQLAKMILGQRPDVNPSPYDVSPVIHRDPS